MHGSLLMINLIERNDNRFPIIVSQGKKFRHSQQCQTWPLSCDLEQPTLYRNDQGQLCFEVLSTKGCLVDFGLYFYYNHSAFRHTQGAGFGPFFCLPKMEHSTEAKIWNSAFEKAEKVAGIERGSIMATVRIETLPVVLLLVSMYGIYYYLLSASYVLFHCLMIANIALQH
ncbi:hypothetical protein VNO78_24907 [Psophocarpus tetragonolobus]|uniref:malate synthase n=1 Tax=Psophocarpus tetragonolobus TaxID=3891 RepID=A0AAN9XEU5_PSOTE